jgi:hypothetical protein
LYAAETVWPFLLIEDETKLDDLRRSGCVPWAVAEGKGAAADVRRSYRDQSSEAILVDLGVEIIESEATPKLAWRHRRSEYFGRPPRVIVYRKALVALGALAADAGLAAEFPAPDMRNLVLAHELYHHLAFQSRGRVSDRCRVPWIYLGPLMLRRREPALDEIAAHAFTQALLSLPLSPTMLDWLTLYGDHERFGAFAARAERLVEAYGLS